nr:hypothetical protein [Neorhizobium lilium]
MSTYSAYISDHRELLRLDAQRSMLERNLEESALMDLKEFFMKRLAHGGRLLEEALGLTEGRGIQLLTRSYALTCGLWQALGPDTKPISSPDFADLQPEFKEELYEALTEYWRGALIE